MSTSTSNPLPIADMARLATIIHGLSPRQLEAWLTCGRRVVAGMPTAEAEALMWSELAAGGQA